MDEQLHMRVREILGSLRAQGAADPAIKFIVQASINRIQREQNQRTRYDVIADMSLSDNLQCSFDSNQSLASED
jgi:hypothetical protein